MSERENNIEILESQIPAASASAFAAARERALESGQSILESHEGCIYEVYPDGKRILLKKIERPTLVLSGSKITIG
jgi:hypothetical protein